MHVVKRKEKRGRACVCVSERVSEKDRERVRTGHMRVRAVSEKGEEKNLFLAFSVASLSPTRWQISMLSDRDAEVQMS